MVGDLDREYAARRTAGLPVERWDKSDIERYFPYLLSDGALWTLAGAEVDAVLFCHALLQPPCTTVRRSRN